MIVNTKESPSNFNYKRDNLDVAALELRQGLLDNGVLRTLETEGTHASVATSIVRNLEHFSKTSSQEPEALPERKDRFSSFKPDGFDDFFLVSTGNAPLQDGNTPLDNELRGRFRRGPSTIAGSTDIYQLSGGSTAGALSATSHEQLAKSLVWSMNYRHSGAYEDCVSILRDMYYICMSETVSLPYWPQLDRIEFSKNYPSFVTDSTRTQLYQLLADALHTAVSEVERDFNSGTSFIPPFAAIAMSRSSTPAQLLENIFAVREEFHGLRRQLGDLERQRVEAASIKDRRKITEEHKRLLNEAANAFDDSRIISFEALVRYIPEVVKPAATPADPTEYSSNLLLQPVEWLVQWWRRRPLSKLLRVADQVQELKNYDQLVTQVFGDHLLKET